MNEVPTSGLRRTWWLVAEKEYQVPQRLPLAGIMTMISLLAVVLAAFRAYEAPSELYVFTVLLCATVVLAQMRFPALPRWSSMLVGILVMACCIGIYRFFLGRSFMSMGFPEYQLDLFSLYVFALLAGYFVGTLAAGVFLVLDWLRPQLNA